MYNVRKIDLRQFKGIGFELGQVQECFDGLSAALVDLDQFFQNSSVYRTIFC
ncbi:hypothetical protein X956_00305 [Trueperella pyogenes TP8]|nr:hypothetical protein X956_00305 [Trueperella pyogenes TP8]